MDSADRSGSDRDAATDGSESGPTAEDSGGEDDVFSDLEYSRVIPTPASQRGDRARTRSTPKTPRRGARDSNNETPVAARQPTYSQLLDATYYNGNADGNGDSAPETQTQKVLPVTATQLQELGLGFAGTPASPHIPDTSLPSQELGVEPDDATARSRGATPDAEAQAAEADAEEALPGLIESDDERVSSGSEELGTPRVAQLGTASYGSGGVVDETPLRYEPFSVPPHVYVLCLWQRKWYPARAERADYEAAQLGPRVASVTFADATTARTDLSLATEFDLQVGDRVQVESDAYRGKKFEVVHLIADDSVTTGRIRTTSGHTAARLRLLTPAKSSASAALVVVEVGDVSLTRSDHERWLAARRRMRERESQASPTDGRLARLARRKRPRSAEDAALPVATPPTSRPTSRRRKIAGSREASLLAAAPAAAAAATAPQRIFSNCVFSISMSDQADDESEEIKQLILSHGGTVLDNGLSDAVRLTDATQSGDMPGHELQFADAAFAAVLAEKPRRTIKYLEMLAVGWPCLMSGFVKECIEQGQFIDWVPWTLPAGVSSVRRKSGAVVNANISQFQHGWLRGEKLATQFVKRHVILKCTVPICVVVGHERSGPHAADAQRLDAQRLFLASLCAPQYKLWVYMNRDDVPAGSLLLLLGEKKGLKSLATEPHTLHQMKNLASADDIIVKDASWLLECIINGELI